MPIEEDASSDSSETSVTYDTSTYQDLAAAGGDVVQQCISNRTRASGGWQLAGIPFFTQIHSFSRKKRADAVSAGDNEALVLHLYATGSEIDKTIKQQTSTEIAATNEDEVQEAELDDPVYQDIDGGIDDGADNSTIANSTSAAGSGTAADGQAQQPSTSNTAAVPNAAPPQTVQKSSTFSYTGCEVDNTNSRTLSSKQWSGQNLTVERCAAYCSQYQYMGVEFGSE